MSGPLLHKRAGSNQFKVRRERFVGGNTEVIIDSICVPDWEGHLQRIQMFDFYPLPDDQEQMILDDIEFGI
jgi:hypothetical protein